ncbi:hypothetical protein SLG_00200 [Sphingobium sp. SYK-6]|uniref:hypothetical protein n=1 Tax=Sphingobium sp. (strain NBRC 103272 / SYK-6) TaxID=627192 RepID=UPI00022768F9|nr:hypothetical protein [Sphingobium sp. SYK-6]BAK64695.1 hypothetical protein SLG_00200 [Sphingobium sp. SYK-6]
MIEVDLRRLCTITQGVAHQHMPAWANLTANVIKGTKTDPGDLAGPGIYTCFWDRALIYIGAYSGLAHDPFGGHVIDRAFKHIVGFTLRSDQLFFNDRPLRAIIDGLDHEIARDLARAREQGDRVRSGGGPETALGPNGAFCATERKARFAARHWDVLRGATPDELFRRLTFAYRRLMPPASLVSKKAIQKDWIDQIEKKLITAFEPCCNTSGRRGPDGPPASLQQVSEALDTAIAAVRASHKL